MAAVELKRDQWPEYFSEFSDQLVGKVARIEVAALALGHLIAADSVALRGMTYDHKNDLLDLDLGGLGHLIRHPLQIFVLSDPRGVTCIEVIDSQGVTHAVCPREPVPVP